MNGLIIEGGWWWNYLPKVNRAMALFPVILVRKGVMHPGLLQHERIHLAQQLELLVLPFYLWYMLEYIGHRLTGKDHLQAYMAISFEREAYAHENEDGYLQRRPFWAFLKRHRL
jgi:hypothetical protein